ncbi:EEIG1/EHBP1 N-terminal domain-containing protein [Circinella umbellata]|nr:EEIG1/EHBP1 N-terminal domain-containing protein [Circinella umbellata]
MALLNFFISKHRKLDFEISILIRDLANVPLVSGLYYVKWRIKNASHASGITERAPINDHCIFWNHPINTMSQLVLNKQQVLGACELKLEIFQELSGGKETHSIGSLTINLSEYADSGVSTRRYLLDQSKFNSTIKLSIRMKPKSDVGTNFHVWV